MTLAGSNPSPSTLPKIADGLSLFAREAAFDKPRRHQAHVARMTGEDVADRRTIEEGLAAGRHAHRRRELISSVIWPASNS